MRWSVIALTVSVAWSCGSEPAPRIILMPVQGRMMVNAVVPALDRQVFGVGIPETIGSGERMWLVNHPDVSIVWETDSSTGVVSTKWRSEGVIEYRLSLVPADDRVDIVMSLENLSATVWHDVFTFNCISPAKTHGLHDTSLTRTYLSIENRPTVVADLPRVRGPRPTITVYPTVAPAKLPPFAAAFEATVPVRSDGSWMAVVDDRGETYMATTTPNAAFLFTNTKLGCIHAAPAFGDLEPEDVVTVTSRVYLAHGTLRDFLARYESDRADG